MPAAPWLRSTASKASLQFSSATTASISVSYMALRRKVRKVPASSRRCRACRGCTASGLQRSQVGDRSCRDLEFSSLLAPVPSSFSSSVLWFFGPSLHRRYAASSLLRPLLTSPPLSWKEISPGKVQNLSPRAVWLYLMRLDDLWASLFRASLPPAPGLTASSCSYGRRFASRFFQLRLAVTPCGSLRLPSSAPIGSFHPTRFCPCWAH